MIRRVWWSGFGLALAVQGCFYDPTGSEPTGTTSSGPSSSGGPFDTSSGGSVGTTTAETPTTTLAGEDTTTSVGPTTSSSDSSTTAANTDGTTDVVCQDEYLAQPDSASCKDASGCGCASGACFTIPIVGGFCGECLGDADCRGGGCTVPNPLIPVGSICNQGEAGAGCQSDEVCVDADNARCGTVLEVPGIFTVATCGECTTDDECTAPGLPNCSPNYAITMFTGKLTCVGDNSVANGGGCNLADDGNGVPLGDSACMSGRCGAAFFEGLIEIGLCGECNSDIDCDVMGMTTCNDATATVDGVTMGSFCS